MSDFSIMIQMILVVFLIISAIGVSVTKNLFMAVIVFMGYSSIMAIVWLFLEAPDLAITEAAVGAGVDTLLFFLTLKKVHALKGTREG
jgi:uncharacterized MnhB-related membrane protein